MIAVAIVAAFAGGVVVGILLESRRVLSFMEGQRSGWELRDVSGMAKGEAHVPDAEIPLQDPVTFDPFVYKSGDESEETESE